MITLHSSQIIARRNSVLHFPVPIVQIRGPLTRMPMITRYMTTAKGKPDDRKIERKELNNFQAASDSTSACVILSSFLSYLNFELFVKSVNLTGNSVIIVQNVMAVNQRWKLPNYVFLLLFLCCSGVAPFSPCAFALKGKRAAYSFVPTGIRSETN